MIERYKNISSWKIIEEKYLAAFVSWRYNVYITTFVDPQDASVDRGDSGGPLVCRDRGGGFVLVGTTSYGQYKPGQGYIREGLIASHYQRVSAFAGWIRDTVARRSLGVTCTCGDFFCYPYYCVKVCTTLTGIENIGK